MSSSIKKVTSGISSALYGDNSLGSALFPQHGTSALENLLRYYSGLDTSTADNTLHNLEQEAYDLSGDLTSYISSIDGSDNARQEVQNATLQSYLSTLLPQHQQQTSDLNTRLLNQGLTVGSEAYQRAMNDLTEEQNQAINQATYQSVIAGNEAFNDSFKNDLLNAELANNVRQAELNEIYRLLANTLTKEELMEKIYQLQAGIDKTNYQNDQSIYNGYKDVLSGTLNNLLKI